MAEAGGGSPGGLEEARRSQGRGLGCMTSGVWERGAELILGKRLVFQPGETEAQGLCVQMLLQATLLVSNGAEPPTRIPWLQSQCL